MQHVTVELALTDEDAKGFEGADLTVIFPTTQAEYLAFLDAAEQLHRALQIVPFVLRKMEVSGGVTGGATEGLEHLSKIAPHMIEMEKTMQAFFARHSAVATQSRRKAKGRMQ